MTQEQSIFLSQLESLVDSSIKVKNQAWETLNEIGLPSKKSEAYKYTSITKMLDSKISLDLQNDASFDKSQFYSIEGTHLVVINGVISKENSIIKEDIKLVSSEVTEGKHDPFSLLNTAFASQEILIETGKDALPVFIYYWNTIGFFKSQGTS